MKGFCFVIKDKYNGDLINKKGDKIFCDSFYVKYDTLSKFKNDCVFTQDNGKIYLLDGVVFNKKDILNDSDAVDWNKEYVRCIEDNEMFFDELRGSFHGVTYDYKNNKLMAFVNHSGEKALFYYHNNDLLIVSSHMVIMYEALKKYNQPIKSNIQASREMLVTGSFLHGNTIIDGVRRLTAGKYITYLNGDLEEKRYHMFRNVPEHDLSLDECIDKADELFRQAVDRIFSKNVEYGYQAEADLSGGLDSRLATWVAHDLGYKDIINLCYCQKGRIDNISSKKIANYLGNEYFFFPMNGGDFLMDVDQLTRRTGGQVVYCVCTGANRAFDILKNRNIGLAVTGLLGEIHNAYWVEGDKHTPARYTSNTYSQLLDFEEPKEYREDYDNFEQMNLYEYSHMLFLSSAFARQDRCEVYSPFIDKDYMEFAYRIPLKYRKDYYFTMNWIMKKYPEAAQFVWQTKRKPIDKAYHNKLYLPQIVWRAEDYACGLYNRVCRTLKINSQLAYKGDMNPFDLWYNSNAKLRKFLQDYYTKNIKLIEDVELRKSIDKMYNSNCCRDKILVTNLLSIYKLYFSE